MMTLNATSLPRGQLLKRNIALADIARVVSGADIASSVRSLRFAGAWLQRDNVIEGESSGSSALDGWVNGLVAQVAMIAVAFNDSLVIHCLNYCLELVGLASQIFLSYLLRFGLAICAVSLSILFLVFQIEACVVFWSLFPVFTTPESTALLEEFVVLVLLCKMVSRFALFALGVTPKDTSWVNVEVIKKLFGFASCAKFIAGSWNRVYLGVEVVFERYLGPAFLAGSSSSVRVPLFLVKAFNGLFNAACTANLGRSNRVREVKQEGLLNGMIEWVHDNMVSLTDCVVAEVMGVATACGLDSFTSILPQIAQFVNREWR